MMRSRLAQWWSRRYRSNWPDREDDWFKPVDDDYRLSRHASLAAIVLVASVCLTVLAWYLSSVHVKERARDRFDYQVIALERAIRDRMYDYQLVLRQTATLLGDPRAITHDQWRDFYDAIDFESAYPGTRAFGLLLPVPRDEVDAYTRSTRALGFPGFRVYPESDSPITMPAHFVEPLGVRNNSALGFDPLTDPVRRKAIELAIASGDPTITGRIPLLPEPDGSIRPGILFVMPAYADTLPKSPTPRERRQHLAAVVFTALGMDELMEGILGSQTSGVHFRLHDALANGDDTELYLSSDSSNPMPTLFEASRAMSVFGHEWHLDVSASKGFMLDSELQQSLLVAVAGVLVDLILFASIWLLSRQHEHARDGALRLFKAFQDGEERFRLVVNAADGGLLMVDGNGRITLANAASALLLGYSRGTMLGMHVTELLPSLDWDHCAAPLLMQPVSVAGEFEGQATRLQVHGMRRDSSCFPADVALTPMRFNSEPYVLVGINDITERQAQESERERQMLELQRSNEDLESFAHVASHDLKAPLRAVDNLASWVVEDAGETLSEESRRHLSLMRKRIARMDSLLTDLLVYGRASRESHRIERVDLCRLVDEVRELSRPAEGFVFSKAGDVPVVETSRVPLRQVLINLVGNAIKHRGAAQGRVEVRWRARANWLEFEVSDDGPGIDKEYRTRVFELYQTLKPRDSVESNGMGLALVKRIVERYGGTVAIVDSPVAGTLVRFTWPLQHEASDRYRLHDGPAAREADTCVSSDRCEGGAVCASNRQRQVAWVTGAGARHEALGESDEIRRGDRRAREPEATA